MARRKQPLPNVPNPDWVEVIARDELMIPSLEVKRLDRHDFKEVHIANLRRALEKAYAMGVAVGRRETEKQLEVA